MLLTLINKLQGLSAFCKFSCCFRDVLKIAFTPDRSECNFKEIIFKGKKKRQFLNRSTDIKCNSPLYNVSKQLRIKIRKLIFWDNPVFLNKQYTYLDNVVFSFVLTRKTCQFRWQRCFLHPNVRKFAFSMRLVEQIYDKKSQTFSKHFPT